MLLGGGLAVRIYLDEHGDDFLHLFTVYTVIDIFILPPPAARPPTHRNIRFLRRHAWLNKEMLLVGVVVRIQ